MVWPLEKLWTLIKAGALELVNYTQYTCLKKKHIYIHGRRARGRMSLRHFTAHGRMSLSQWSGALA